MQTRIYVVIRETENTSETRLVTAASQAQALRHVAKGDYSVKVASTKDVAHWMGLGAKIEAADSSSAAVNCAPEDVATVTM